MNGFNLLKTNSFHSYIEALGVAEAYEEGECTSIDIEVVDSDFTLMFMKPMVLPESQKIATFILDLIKLDEFIAKREYSKIFFDETGQEFEFSYAEIESDTDLTMFYCGINVNAQWGAEFTKNESAEWVFSGLC